MQKLVRIFSSHPWWVILVLVGVSLLSAFQIGNVRIQISAEELLVMNDPERKIFEEMQSRFGDDDIVLVLLQDTKLLTKEKLAATEQFIKEVEALPFVKKTESLFTVPYLKTVDGFLNKEPYLAKPPASDQEARQILDKALDNPFVKQVLLSADAGVMVVAVMLNEQSGDDLAITTQLDRLVLPLKSQFTDAFAIGSPYVRTEITEKMRQEQVDLFPWAVAALLISLFLLLRQLIDILSPILTSGISILWTLGLMGLLDIPLNLITSTVPILLIIVGSTEDIHLLSAFRHGQKAGLETQQALRLMSRKMGRTVLLTFITTYVGFLSVGFSGIEALWQFGFLASTGLLLNFIITISLIPALLALTGQWQLDGKSQLFRKRNLALVTGYWDWLERNRWKVFALFGLCALAAATGFPGIHVNHHAIDSLSVDSKVRAQLETANENLAGLESFSIILDSGIEDTFLKVRYLEELRKIQNYISKTGLSRSTTSFVDYLALLNGAFQEFEHPEMPYSDEIVDELMIFLNYDLVRAYVSKDYSSARILVRHDISSTRKLKAYMDDLKAFIDSGLDPGLKAKITGNSVLALSATRAMIDGQLQSILLLLIFFVIIISLIFMDLRVGLLASLPNIFPVIVLFGVMGYADIPLNIGTAMAAAIAIGIAVDDTMHFMLRYNQEIRVSKSQSGAMYTTIYEEALPVISTSIALIAGFLVFAQSDFEPLAQFGMLSALVIGTALVADFVITPLAISSLRLVTLWDLMSSTLRHQIIPRSQLFQGMRPWQIRRFILSSMVLEFAPGELVFKKDDESEALFLVMKGLVEVSVPISGKSKKALLVDRFSAGELFGDVAMLAREHRRANAVAVTPTSVLVLTRESIKSTTTLHPFIASRLFLNLAVDVSKRWVRFIARLHEEGETADPEEEETDEVC
ncbi:MAG: MMPL family transporter [Gammaproteobacteria bacterium]|nr:MMPL family transporter [Gammaproteobacteria bacterium]